MLSEIATGERQGKVLALVDVRRAYFYAPARRKVFVELPPEDYQPGDEHMCGLLRYSLYGTRDGAQYWGEELGSAVSGLGLTRGSACPCVWTGRIKGRMSWQPCTARTSQSVGNGRQPHQDDIQKVRDQETSARRRPRTREERENTQPRH